MPHKHNADRRHHIPKMSFKVQNWPEYEAGLRRRGSMTLWIEDAALECWQTCGPGGQARYTDAAIQTSLMVRAAFADLLVLVQNAIHGADRAAVDALVEQGCVDFRRRLIGKARRVQHIENLRSLFSGQRPRGRRPPARHCQRSAQARASAHHAGT